MVSFVWSLNCGCWVAGRLVSDAAAAGVDLCCVLVHMITRDHSPDKAPTEQEEALHINR